MREPRPFVSPNPDKKVRQPDPTPQTASRSQVDDDLLAALRELLPADDRWRHAHGSRGHGRSHVMPALVPPYCTVPVVGGKLQLGTWQSICLVDLNVDNAVRTVRLSLLGG